MPAVPGPDAALACLSGPLPLTFQRSRTFFCCCFTSRTRAPTTRPSSCCISPFSTQPGQREQQKAGRKKKKTGPASFSSTHLGIPSSLQESKHRDASHRDETAASPGTSNQQRRHRRAACCSAIAIHQTITSTSTLQRASVDEILQR